MFPEIFEDSTWQMSRGERAAIEGVLAQLRPALAIEIGSMEGACLLRIAAQAGEVHSFDLDAPTLPMPDNVTLHTGDSHLLLPQFLAELAERDRHVDLVMVDGDHTPEGVRQDVEDLLNSPALAHTVILIHDTANERVRSGLDAVHFAAWPKVAHVELDWIPGQLFAEPALRNELWYGLGLVLIDSSRLAYLNGDIYQQRYHPMAPLLADVRTLVQARERLADQTPGLHDDPITWRMKLAELGLQLHAARTGELDLQTEVATLRQRLTRSERTLEDVMGSLSWKVTQPLRAAKREAARRAKS